MRGLMVSRKAVAVAVLALAFVLASNAPAGSEPAAQGETLGTKSGVGFPAKGVYVEHTPSIVQLSNGTWFIAYESAPSISGHFTINCTWSVDGRNWARSWIGIDSLGTMGNRHPTLIQRRDGQLMVVYFSDRSGAYRVYSATSTNGRTWTESAALALQNPAINPFIIQEDNGNYSMSYQRYGSASDGAYFAKSTDGITWTASATRVAQRSLPRLMRARNNGNYLMTMQGGSTGAFEIRYRTSPDGTTWSAEYTLTATGNSHDSHPIQLKNGSYMVFFATAAGGSQPYDLYRKWSPNMSTWSTDELIDVGNARYDTEPHVFQVQSNETIALAWGYEASGTAGAYADVDVALIWLRDVVQPYYNVALHQGWNLVSLPLIQGDARTPMALTSIAGQYDRTMWRSPTSPTDPWKQYYTGWSSALNDFKLVNHSMGFWLNVTATTATLNVTGALPTSTMIQLRAGWNLIGYPARVDSSYTVGQLKSATGATTVEGCSSGATYKTAVLADSYVMKRGEGYWAQVPSDASWTVNW